MWGGEHMAWMEKLSKLNGSGSSLCAPKGPPRTKEMHLKIGCAWQCHNLVVRSHSFF